MARQLVIGGMQDWNYVFSNCFEITIEMGCSKFPKSDEVKSFWNDNKFALLAFMNKVRQIMEEATQSGVEMH